MYPMTLDSKVLVLAATAASAAVPTSAGVVSSDIDELIGAALRLVDDPDQAAAMGAAARAHALKYFGLDRFLSEWDQLLEGVA
jgi:glycosyltransferase involved in cell wall biosynthesis